jgi:tetratricopeptide (TPR) repeat protein
LARPRILEEFSDVAVSAGAAVLRGACYDGEWQQPYGAFAEAIAGYARSIERDELKRLTGRRAGILARIAPSLHDLLDEIEAPPEIAGEDERFRLFDTVTQFFLAITERAPLILMLDDLHWADRGVTSMLSHVAHFTPRHRILIVGAYRDAEVSRRHPLTDSLAGLSRLRGFDGVTLQGLNADDLSAMLARIANRDPPPGLTAALDEATEGNPLFIREVLLHLFEEGKIQSDGKGLVTDLDVEQLGIPEGVRQVIGQRLARLSDEANRLLTVAGAFNGAFSFEVAAAAAGLDESTALATVDEALEAQLLRPGAAADTFDFTHALIRQTLYGNLNPARRPRMHRKIAEEMERTWGERAAQHAAEVAFHFWRAAATGTQRGVEYAIAAADHAATSYAHDDAATFLRIALDLLAPDDRRRIEILSRLSLALTWALNAEEAVARANEAGELITRTRDGAEGAVFYEQIARAMFNAGLTREAWELAKAGLRQIGDRRDVVWASLVDIDINRSEAEDPASPGVALDSQESRELAAVLRTIPQEQLAARNIELIYFSRDEILRNPDPKPRPVMMTGDYRAAEARWRREAVECEQRGAAAQALRAWAGVTRCHTSMGNFVQARAAFDHASAIAARMARPSFGKLALQAARAELHLATNEDLPQLVEDFRAAFGGQDQEIMDVIQGFGPEGKWGRSVAFAFAALAFAGGGEPEVAINFLSLLPTAIERGAPWSLNYVGTACMAATAVWILNRSDNLELMERNIREKVVKPDFHFPMSDGRLSLARVCALQGRHEEASQWFTRAREFLEGHGSRPLRAIADFDEGLMYVRRAAEGDPERARPFLDSAITQFAALGMTGWVRRAEGLLQGHPERA